MFLFFVFDDCLVELAYRFLDNCACTTISLPIFNLQFLKHLLWDVIWYWS